MSQDLQADASWWGKGNKYGKNSSASSSFQDTRAQVAHRTRCQKIDEEMLLVAYEEKERRAFNGSHHDMTNDGQWTSGRSNYQRWDTSSYDTKHYGTSQGWNHDGEKYQGAWWQSQSDTQGWDWSQDDDIPDTNSWSRVAYWAHWRNEPRTDDDVDMIGEMPLPDAPKKP
jgi:hypothetical protein